MALELNLSGKTAVITGASEGIGKAVAEKFGEEGVDMWIAARTKDKIEAVATRIYRAGRVVVDAPVQKQLRAWEKAGHGGLPVCIAKTQYSFTSDPARLGAPDKPCQLREV